MDDTQEVSVEALVRDCRAAFATLAPALRHQLGEHAAAPRCSFAILERETFDARVRRPGGLAGRAVVEVSTGLLVELHDALSRASGPLAPAIAGPEAALEPDAALATLYDLALHFVLLHELYHVYEGHLVYLGREKGTAAVVESTVGLGGSALEADVAYFLELEADGSALTSLVSHLAFEHIESIARQAGEVSTTDPCVHELRGDARDTGFRAALAALWITIALIERHRAPDGAMPRALARLLGAVSGLMAWYAELDALRVDERGAVLQRLTGEQASSLRRFLDQVVRPVATALEAPPPGVESGTLGFFEGAADRAAFFADLRALVANARPDGTAGRQLVACEARRRDLERALGPGRLFRVLRGEGRRIVARRVEVLVEPAADSSVDALERAVAEVLDEQESATIESRSRTPMPGIGGAEIAVSFVVGIASSLTVEALKALVAARLKSRRLKSEVSTTELDDDEDE